eukprot:GHVT01096295.1.p1 GENE.GHVT01096295.1~~GHVT01096295.1.p1  ORF type:complete len:275 (-),score=59.18 GHVT01096295.1:628-1452(-)
MAYACDSAEASTMPHLPRGERNPKTGKLDVHWPSAPKNAVCFKILSEVGEPAIPTRGGRRVPSPFCFAETKAIRRTSKCQQVAPRAEVLSLRGSSSSSVASSHLSASVLPSKGNTLSQARGAKRKTSQVPYAGHLSSAMNPLPALHDDLLKPFEGNNVGLKDLMNEQAMMEDPAALPGDGLLSFLEKIDDTPLPAAEISIQELPENASSPTTATEVGDDFTPSEIAYNENETEAASEIAYNENETEAASEIAYNENETEDAVESATGAVSDIWN